MDFEQGSLAVSAKEYLLLLYASQKVDNFLVGVSNLDTIDNNMKKRASNTESFAWGYSVFYKWLRAPASTFANSAAFVPVRAMLNRDTATLRMICGRMP